MKNIRIFLTENFHFFVVKFSVYLNRYVFIMFGRLDEAKVSRILHHRGLQLIFTYSWARPAILAAGKGKGGMLFLLFLLFLRYHSFSFIPYLSFSSSAISFISVLPYGPP